MSTATAPPPHEAPPPTARFGPGRVVSIVVGSLVALLAIGLVLGGLALLFAHVALRDDDGYFNSPTRSFSTPTHALTAERLRLGDLEGQGGDWAVEQFAGRVRVRAELTGGAPVFIGIARERELDAYLSGVAHDRVLDDRPTRYERARGARRPAPPASQRFWVASASGPGQRTAEWEVRGGRWGVVVMKSDGTRGVSADVRVGAEVDWVLGLGIALLAVGLMFGAGAAALLWTGVHRPRGPGAGAFAVAPAAPPATATATAEPPTAATEPGSVSHPVELRAELDEPLSPWLWLVKWILVIPHAIVLAFLWIAFAFLWIVALVAIVATGRYPRAIFDFNVGVLRWTWRVGYYAWGAIGTDRYPPFTLASVPDYPADLEIPYPERLSRGKALVKWWLLAIPHYVALTALLGGGWWPFWWAGTWSAGLPGLLPLLVLVAGFVLLFTGRYPRDVFRLVVGINRWALRVAAYAALMRDEYPPFRLER